MWEERIFEEKDIIQGNDSDKIERLEKLMDIVVSYRENIKFNHWSHRLNAKYKNYIVDELYELWSTIVKKRDRLKREERENIANRSVGSSKNNSSNKSIRGNGVMQSRLGLYNEEAEERNILRRNSPEKKPEQTPGLWSK